MLPLFLFLIAFVPMLLEARLAARNSARLRRQGAVEPPEDVYAVMQVAYPACFLAMVAEAWVRDVRPDAVFVAGAVIFLAAKGLKYWAMATLGERWTFRVLVPPDSSRILRGPYQFLRHPNYVGVIGEILGMATMSHAAVTGPLSVIVFAVLLVSRIRVEERALHMRPE
jgi:methyltransferase